MCGLQATSPSLFIDSIRIFNDIHYHLDEEW